MREGFIPSSSKTIRRLNTIGTVGLIAETGITVPSYFMTALTQQSPAYKIYIPNFNNNEFPGEKFWLQNTHDFLYAGIGFIGMQSALALITPRVPQGIRTAISFALTSSLLIFAETVHVQNDVVGMIPHHVFGTPDLLDLPWPLLTLTTLTAATAGKFKNPYKKDQKE